MTFDWIVQRTTTRGWRDMRAFRTKEGASEFVIKLSRRFGNGKYRVHYALIDVAAGKR